jgi:hypothetical protein
MMKPMIALSGVLLMLGACKSSSDSKTEANTLSRKYNRPATEVWTAATNALQTLDLRIEEDRHDALGGKLSGVRATGDAVSILVKSLDETSAQVSVHVEGGERNMADVIHAQIAKNLGTSTAKTSFYGGNRWENTYDTSLARALMAAERACEAIGFTVSNRDLRENSADLMARRAGASTVLLHFETPAADQPKPVGPQAPANGGPPKPASAEKTGQVKVSMIAGTMRTEENEELLQRMRAEFERFLK